jgi:hypothetical protein
MSRTDVATKVKAVNISNAPVSCNYNDGNIISFRCNSPILGAVKIGYLSSYGAQWGVARVNVSQVFSISYGSESAVMKIEESSVYIDSKWSLLYSLLQETLLEAKAGSGMHLLRVDVSISMCTGSKFKPSSMP